MGNGTRSGLRNKDGENHSSRKDTENREGISNASSRTASTSGSKQSAKGASSGQATSNPSSTRKSERLEKRTLPTTPITRKSERLINHSTPSPLRRSDRGKKHGSSSPSGSNHSSTISSADAKKRKEKKEKSIQQLTLESQKLTSSEKSEQESISPTRKRMDAYSYKSLFKSQKRRHTRTESNDMMERQDRLSQIDGGENGGSVSKLNGDMEDGIQKYEHALSLPVGLRVAIEHPRERLRAASKAASARPVPDFKDIEANMSENDAEKEANLYVSENLTDNVGRIDENISQMSGTNNATLDDAKKGPKDHSSIETLKIPALVASSNIQRSVRSDNCSESAAHIGTSKGSSFTRDMLCEVTEKEFGKDPHALVVEGACMTLANHKKHDIVGTCVVCHKKRRLVYDSPEQELCSCIPVEKDAGDVELASNSGCVGRCDDITGLNETLSDGQTDNDGNICVKCNQPGQLLYCCGKGCRRCYHLSCLDPILYDAPPGVWHCSYCTKKKIEFGVYTVTKGVESIWDDREVVLSDAKETRRQKQYLVKYQGLAHVYNHWIPESELILETPSLIAEYKAKNQRSLWKPEWTIPSRLLRKRLLISSEPEDKCSSMGTDKISDCQYAWLVKWCGLDYVHATWELENSNFLQSPQGQKLIREYEIRYEKSKRVVDKTVKVSYVKLKDRLSAGGSTLSDDCYLQNVNKLRELWYKCQNAVVFDGQERFANVISFIFSLSNDHQPFLIISTSEALSHWEAEFSHWAPSVDVVVYKGNIETRSSIRILEFSEEDKGGTMLQVLLSPIEVVIEDLQSLKWLKWKVIVIDDCQSAFPELEKLKLLETDMRLLLFSGPIKDTVAEYSSLLSLLGSPDDPDKARGLKSDAIDNLVKSKELLARFTAYSKFDSKFVEYLVPVEISNLQLEQYCGKLLSNAPALRSNCKTDQVGAFKEILMTLRKCCDHPYMVASSLQSSLIEGLTLDRMLEIGIEASGKLQLLHEILLMIRNQRLRALILFQSIGGTGELTIGDILDDFVRGKFGPNSYERIDACLLPSKKQAALNKFNDIGGEHFVFLLENRACQPSIKLSVDTIVIFDSDWNPANDLKALQRLSIHSKNEQVNIFRLYSSCTIEEKVLILGKQNLNLESSLQTIRFSTTLLMWGASYLFSRLDEYHSGNSTDNVADISYGQKLLFDVLSELSAILSGCSEENDKCEPVISKVFRDAGTYSTNCPLLGERKVQLTDVEEPHIFWKKLLEGKTPKWKFSLGQMPRSRKRVQFAQESSRKSDFENDDTLRKRKKVVGASFSAAPVLLEQEESQVASSDKEASLAATTKKSRSLPVSVTFTSNKLNAKNTSSSLHFQGSFTNQNSVAHLQAKSPSDEQKSLHAFVKEEMVKLCEILNLSKEVKEMIDRFLEYVMENHHVNKEPSSILQAFQMSLCWTAVSILKQKIDKKDSLELAKRILDFKCTEEEASSVYLKLRLLKKAFLQLPGITSGSISQSFKSVSRDAVSPSPANAGEPPSGSFNLQNGKANQELAHARESNNRLTDLEKTIKKIQKKCDKRMSKLHQKHQMEIQELQKTWADKKEKLEADHRKEVIFVRAIHGNGPMGMAKLKMSDTEFAKKMQEREHLKEMQLRKLQAKHSAATEDERGKVSKWLAEAKSCSNLCGTVNELRIPGSESEDEIGFFNTAITAKGTGNDVLLSGLNIEQGLDGIVPDAEASDAPPSNLLINSDVETFGCKIPGDTAPILLNLHSERDSETRVVESIFGFELHKECCRSSQAVKDIPAADMSTENHVADEIPSAGQNDKMPSREPCNTESETGHAYAIGISTSVNISTSDEQSADKIALTNERHDIVSGNVELEMGHDHTLDTPVELSVINDRGNVTSDITRNQTDQFDADLSDSLPSDAIVCLQNKESRDMQNEGTQVTGDQTTTTVGAQLAPGTNSLSNCEEIENNEQLEQASEDIAPGRGQCPGAGDVHQGHNPVAYPHLQEESVAVSHQNVYQGAENMVHHPHVELSDSAQVQNHPDSLTDNRADCEPNSELLAHARSGEAQVSQIAAELPNQVVSQSDPNSAMVDVGHLQLYGPNRVAPWNATLPLHSEPLQNELERIHKDMEQLVKLHDSTKLQLKSDCEKEIEEMVAQIRRKYDAKIKDAETVFVPKRAELESNRSKVLMNKLLADAFRSKCTDFKTSGTSGVMQVVPSSFMQHLQQLSSRPTTRHSPVISQHAVNLPMQSTYRSPGNFSGLPARPPLINAITPTVVNARVGGELRAPAPHLQPFRPPPCNPNQQLPVNAPVTSAPLPLQAQALLTPQFSQLNLPPPAPLPSVKINQSGSGNQLSESIGGVQPCSHNTSISALELLRNVHNQPSGHAPNIQPSPCSNAGAGDLASDVVCLSDDDDNTCVSI